MRSDRLMVWSLTAAFLAVVPFSVAKADVWDDYGKAVPDYMNYYEHVYTGNVKDAMKADQKLAKKGAKLKAHLAKLQGQLNQEKANIDSDQATETALEDEIKALQKAPVGQPGKALGIFPLSSDQQKALADAQSRATAVKADLVKVQQDYQNDESSLKDTNAQISANQASADKAEAALNRANRDLANYQNPNWVKTEAARVNAGAILEEQKELGFDSKLLLTDLDSKELKNKVSQMQIDALKASWDTQLNNTLLGRYVNQQIEKAMAGVCDPQIQNACAAGKVDVLNKLLNTRLNAAKPGYENSFPAESSSTDDTKNVSQPASPSTATTGNTNSGTVH